MKFGILGNFNKDNFYDIFNELGDFLKLNHIDFYLINNKKHKINTVNHLLLRSLFIKVIFY